MKLQNTISSIELELIHIRPGRQRQDGRDANGELKDTSDLEKSIKQHGLLQPITVSLRTEAEGPGFWLEIGERRLTAHRRLGLTKVLARKVLDLSPIEREVIELAENLHRQDLAWQDTVKAVHRIHLLQLGLSPDWTMGDTAQFCSLDSIGTVSLYISVALEMDNPRVAGASTVREAYNMLKRRNQREAGEALQELLDSPDIVQAQAEPRTDLTEEEEQELGALRELGEPLPAHLLKPSPVRVIQAPPQPSAEAILQESFLTWAPAYVGPKFNLIHCDFPYGVNLFDGKQGRAGELGGQDGQVGYKDTADVYWTLIDCLCQNLPRIMSVSAHLMFWLSADIDIVYRTKARFAELAPALKFHKFPLIWGKSDNAGIASDPKHGPRHTYEVCLLASLGFRNITRVKSDFYSAPTDKTLHPSTKPEPMLRHFMEMLVDETTLLLDPTCGSGASLRAADSLGAKSVLGLEIASQYVGPARLALRQARQKREAGRGVDL